MPDNSTVQLSEAAQNIFENLACRIAERRGGRIVPNHLIPYLPVSLEIIKSCLDNMVDGTAVFTGQPDSINEYEFAAYKDAEKPAEPLKVSRCVACDSDIPPRTDGVLCVACFETLKKELNILAEKMGWPAQAVYEHEILYLAADSGSPQRTETLAGRSRYTLKRMRAKLDRMAAGGYVRQMLESDEPAVTYGFPALSYSRAQYKRNMDVIRTYPASVMEEVQLKLVRILFSLGLLVLLMLVMAVFHVPFPLLVLMFVVLGPAVALFIWRYKSRPVEE